MLKITKKYLALLIAGVLFCSSFPIDGISMQIKAADVTPSETEDAIKTCMRLAEAKMKTKTIYQIGFLKCQTL